MKINNLIIAFCFCTTIVFGQKNPYSQDIKSTYDTIVAATTRGDWDKVLDHTYSKIFTIAPRAQMRAVISKTFTDTSTMKISILDGKVDSVSFDSLVVDNELFVVLYESKKMHIVMTKALSDPEEERNEFLGMMKEAYEKQFGEGNVTLDKEKAAFTMVKKNSLNLCSNTSPTRDKNKWEIMEVKFENPAMMKKLLPEKVISWVKKHQK
jgi:hypothetical protein